MTRVRMSVGVMLAAATLLASAACGDDDPAGASFEAPRYDGTYRGTWTNEQTGASGPVTIAIDIDESSRSADLTIDFGGDYLGLGDPPPARLEGTYDDERARALGENALFGRYDVTIEADGAITGLMEDVGLGAVPTLSYTGTLTEERLDADYKATLADGTTSTAILRMEKEPPG
jgi:hypothetical protein